MAELEVPNEERRPVKMQRVFIKFTNGKTAVFAGPAIFTSAELKLTPLQISDLSFSEPYEMMVRVPKELPSAPTQDQSK